MSRIIDEMTTEEVMEALMERSDAVVAAVGMDGKCASYVNGNAGECLMMLMCLGNSIRENFDDKMK